MQRWKRLFSVAQDLQVKEPVLSSWIGICSLLEDVAFFINTKTFFVYKMFLVHDFKKCLMMN